MIYIALNYNKTSTTTSCSVPPSLSSIDLRTRDIRFSELGNVMYMMDFLSYSCKNYIQYGYSANELN